MGSKWVRAICRSLSRHLPRERKNEEDPAGKQESIQEKADEGSGVRQGQNGWSLSDRIAPLNGPHPPNIFDSSNSPGIIILLNKGESIENSQKVMASFGDAMEQAGGQNKDWRIGDTI